MLVTLLSDRVREYPHLGNTQHSTQWWQAMTYAAYLYGSENYMWAHVYVSTGTCVCVRVQAQHTDRKDKWGTMLTTDESDRCIYLSISVKLSPKYKNRKELPDVTKPVSFSRVLLHGFSAVFCVLILPLSEIPPLLIHSFSFTCRGIFKLRRKRELLVLESLRLNWNAK